MTKILVIQYFIININVRYSNHYQRNILHLQLIKFSFHIRINILDPYHIRPVTEKKYMYYANSNAGNGGQKKHGLSMQAEAIFLFSYICILTYIQKIEIHSNLPLFFMTLTPKPPWSLQILMDWGLTKVVYMISVVFVLFFYCFCFVVVVFICVCSVVHFCFLNFCLLYFFLCLWLAKVIHSQVKY